MEFCAISNGFMPFCALRAVRERVISMNNYYGVNFAKQKEKLLNSKISKVLINDVIEKAESALGKIYDTLKFSEFTLFLETGDRAIYEKKYFERRNDCSYISIAYWLTDDEKYRNQLIDLIFLICDEYTWCVPAHALLHDKPTSKEVIEMIDLFQAETGRLLADIALMIGDKLPYYVNDRIEYEIRRRIIEPIKNREYYWQKSTCTTNWAAVCSGGVLVALLTFGIGAEIEEILPKLYPAVENFLVGYNDDGCCLEGCNYWNYGFGYFAIFARMILEYTNGKVNYFKREKVKNIATFIQKIRLGKTKIVSFSDSSSKFTFSPGLACCLKDIYPDEFILPPLEFGTEQGNIYSMKELLWFNTDYFAGDYNSETTYFKDAQWFVKRNDKFSFAAKAGNNNEPHNHNDIGSFMIVTGNDDIPLTDLGWGVYNAFNFDKKYRYTMLQNASFGHSVPIINGTYQNFGSEYYAKDVTATGNSFSFDMSGAYNEGIIKRLHRSFELTDDRVILCDTVEYSEMTDNFTERMVSLTKPKLNDDFVDLGSVLIMYDNEKYKVSISEDSYKRHADGSDIRVYFIDFETTGQNENIFELVIK